jgi:hypothetical protein
MTGETPYPLQNEAAHRLATAMAVEDALIARNGAVDVYDSANATRRINRNITGSIPTHFIKSHVWNAP